MSPNRVEANFSSMFNIEKALGQAHQTSRVLLARLEAGMDSRFSFPVGLFPPLSQAALARRTPVGP